MIIILRYSITGSKCIFQWNYFWLKLHPSHIPCYWITSINYHLSPRYSCILFTNNWKFSFSTDLEFHREEIHVIYLYFQPLVLAKAYYLDQDQCYGYMFWARLKAAYASYNNGDPQFDPRSISESWFQKLDIWNDSSYFSRNYI